MIKAVTYILENDATVISLVGTNAAGDKTKVYPVVVPQSEKAPYIACRVVGRSKAGKDCDFNYTIEVTSYAHSYDDVSAINQAIITALESETPGTVNDATFGYLNFTNESDDYVRENNLYAKIATFEGMGNEIVIT